MSPDRISLPYGPEELHSTGPQRTLEGDALPEVAFPLGGIGTGCISLGGRGQLRDWEIFNRPNQGFKPHFSFATLRCKTADGNSITRVLESPLLPPYSGFSGTDHYHGEGFPHMQSAVFRGEYPFAWISFEHAHVPVAVSLEAFNPFIPLNDMDSGIPAAILIYKLRNRSKHPVDCVLAWTLQNLIGYGCAGGLNRSEMGGNLNTFRSRDGLKGFVLDTVRDFDEPHRSGSMALATAWPEVTYSAGIGPGWDFNTGHRFWHAIDEVGAFDCEESAGPTEDGDTNCCALGARLKLGPDETAEVPFFIAWHFPNYYKYWGRVYAHEEERLGARWRNYYAHQYDDAWSVGSYVADNLARLREETADYHDALFSSTLPTQVLDAASSQASTLKTPTCLRLEDGTFYGFEGCSPQRGCCPGSCTHVWNYQQALPFLYPSLERGMRSADYEHNLRESDGKMAFRIELPLGTSHWDYHAAADGQLGGVIKTYRDWLISGDDEWLRALWPRVKRSLDYVWEEWDKDRNGLLEGVQHNTYDIELVGPNPLIGCFYLGALRAAEAIAERLGETDDAAEYRRLYEQAAPKMEDLLYNGEYYVQKYDPEQARTQQFGDGCLSDQMLGQWLASVAGLGHLLQPERVRSSLQSVFRYNWRSDLTDHANPQRIYAVGDEAGLLMCSWPHGGRTLIPTMYCDEVWTGIEYQVASHLIMEGLVDEGLALVKGARDRHDGLRRNPWDEPECGSHYARAMSSWGLILALSGFQCCAADGMLQFAPRFRPDDFRVFWSLDSGWGTYSQRIADGAADVGLAVTQGRLEVRTLRLGLPGLGESASPSARVNETKVDCAIALEDGFVVVRFPDGVELREGGTLEVRLTP